MSHLSTGPATTVTSSSTEPDSTAQVAKAMNGIEIIGTVVAHSINRVPLGFEGPSMDILVVKVDKKLEGNAHSSYIRADFWANALTQNTESWKSLYEGKPWRMRLTAPSTTTKTVCAMTVPPLPKPAEIEPFIVPHMVPVAGAKGYPDVNSLVCFELTRDNLQEIHVK